MTDIDKINFLINGLVSSHNFKGITDLFRNETHLREFFFQHETAFERFSISYDENPYGSLLVYESDSTSYRFTFINSDDVIREYDINDYEIINKLDLVDFSDILDKPENEKYKEHVYEIIYEWINESAWEQYIGNIETLSADMEPELVTLAVDESDFPNEYKENLVKAITSRKKEEYILENFPDWEEHSRQIKSNIARYWLEEQYIKETTYRTLRSCERYIFDNAKEYFLVDLKKNKDSIWNSFYISEQVSSELIQELAEKSISKKFSEIKPGGLAVFWN